MFESSGRRVLESSSLFFLSRASQFLGESSSPFIVEGDGLTSQRKREWIRVLPSLVAHAIGYETVVGAHNTVYVRRMWQTLSYLLDMVEDGAHNTVGRRMAPTTL